MGTQLKHLSKSGCWHHLGAMLGSCLVTTISSEWTKADLLKWVKKRMRISWFFPRGLNVTLRSGEWNRNGKALYFLRHQDGLWYPEACVILETFSPDRMRKNDLLSITSPKPERDHSPCLQCEICVLSPFSPGSYFPFPSLPFIYYFLFLASYWLSFVGNHIPKASNVQWHIQSGIDLILLKDNQM